MNRQEHKEARLRYLLHQQSRRLNILKNLYINVYVHIYPHIHTSARTYTHAHTHIHICVHIKPTIPVNVVKAVK